MAAALSAFAVVFVAELGDRTQLLLLALAARHRPLPVVLGLLVGYGLTTVISVAIGAAVGSALPKQAVQVGSGLVFLAFAVWAALDTEDEEEAEEEAAATTARRPVALVASITGAIVLSEIGDKSQLATATLAADGDPVPVAVGALLGILAAGGLGVLVGRLLGDRLRPAILRWGSVVLFATFGVVLLARAVA